MTPQQSFELACKIAEQVENQVDLQKIKSGVMLEILKAHYCEDTEFFGKALNTSGMRVFLTSIKRSTDCYVIKDFIDTYLVSFDRLGCGAVQGRKLELSKNKI